MSATTDLIAQIEDPRLRERLRQEWAAATKEKKFGREYEIETTAVDIEGRFEAAGRVLGNPAGGEAYFPLETNQRACGTSCWR